MVPPARVALPVRVAAPRSRAADARPRCLPGGLHRGARPGRRARVGHRCGHLAHRGRRVHGAHPGRLDAAGVHHPREGGVRPAADGHPAVVCLRHLRVADARPGADVPRGLHHPDPRSAPVADGRHARVAAVQGGHPRRAGGRWPHLPAGSVGSFPREKGLSSCEPARRRPGRGLFPRASSSDRTRGARARMIVSFQDQLFFSQAAWASSPLHTGVQATPCGLRSRSTTRRILPVSRPGTSTLRNGSRAPGAGTWNRHGSRRRPRRPHALPPAPCFHPAASACAVSVAV